MNTIKAFAFAALFGALATAPLCSMNDAQIKSKKRVKQTAAGRRKLGADYKDFGIIKNFPLNPDTLDVLDSVKRYKETLDEEKKRLLDNLILRKANGASKRVQGYEAQEAFKQAAWDLYNDGKPLVKYVPQQNQNPHENKEQG